MNNTISKIEISKLWGKYDIVWNTINPDINIIVGVNGGGKSTLLKIIRDCIEMNSKAILKKYPLLDCKVTMSDGSYYSCDGGMGNSDIPTSIKIDYINIFEPHTDSIKAGESILDSQLNSLLYQEVSGAASFSNYRLRASFGKSKEEIIQSIDELFDLINSLFKKTDKSIEISENNIDIRFRDTKNNIIPIKYLSSGEKQLLIHLFKVFLTEKAPYIALFDEPEVSLHIQWQQKFIEAVTKLNPNMQIFISTHSPSIFGDGWNDKLFFIEDFIIGSS